MLYAALFFGDFRFSQFVADVILDAGVKATVLMLITAVAAFVLRKTSAAIRHRLWCLGFTGACLVPVLSLALPQWRLPVLPSSAIVESAGEVPSLPVETPRPEFIEPAFADRPIAPTETEALMRPEMQTAQNQETTAGVLPTTVEPGPAIDVTTETSHSEAAATIATTTEKAPAVTTRGALAGAWVIGAVLVIAPFALGLIANYWLRYRSRLMSDTRWTRLLDELATKLDLSRPVRLLDAGHSVIPMTWGVLRPIVFLPDDTANWTDARRRFVLLHELAHVKRMDVLFQSIARAACALYWFNPLAWYALRKLRIERELACDDCVVTTGEKATDYAAQLVEIARAYRPARLSVGVAMAHSSKLEHRIVSMLDRARSHLPVGKQIGRCLLASSLLVVLGLSVIGFGERTTTSAEPAPEDGSATAENSATPTNADEQTGEKQSVEPGTVRGRVVDERSNPVPGAKVHVILNGRSMISQGLSHEVALQVATDTQGRFELKLPEYDEVSMNELQSVSRTLTFLATADGFGPDWADSSDDGGEMTFTLVKDTVPLQGRIVDLEGRPVPDVRVRVLSIKTAKSDLADWIAKAQNNPPATDPEQMTGFYYSPKTLEVAHFPVGKSIQVAGLPMFSEVNTDTHGRFKLDGLGPDRWIWLEVEGPNIVKTWMAAVTRPMKPVNYPFYDQQFHAQQTYGAQFDYPSEPAQLITGVIRDADSKEPLADARIGIYQNAGSVVSGNSPVATKTDEQGRYELAGLSKPTDPKRKINLRVVPGPDDPYFRTEVEVPVVAGLGPIQFDIELKRGVWVSGQVTDKETGRPLKGHVSYYPFIDNPQATKYANFRPGFRTIGYDDRHATDEEGKFRIPAIPGGGILAAIGFDGGDYQTAVGAEELGWKTGINQRKQVVYNLHGPQFSNTIQRVEIDPGANETASNIELVPFSRQPVRVVDPQGKPLEDVKIVLGRRPIPLVDGGGSRQKDKALSTSPIELFGLDIEGRRLLLLSHAQRKLGAAIVAEAGKTDEVMLQPLAAITGRLLDSAGVPLAGKHVWVNVKKSEFPETEMTRNSYIQANVQGVQTNDQGNFRLDAIIPGIRYEIMFLRDKLATTEVVQPGQTIELGAVKPE